MMGLNSGNFEIFEEKILRENEPSYFDAFHLCTKKQSIASSCLADRNQPETLFHFGRIKNKGGNALNEFKMFHR